MHYVYIVECADKTLYSGYTNDLDRRITVHNEGKSGAKYTKSRRPVRLVYSEGFEEKGEALRREHALKKLTRVEKLNLVQSYSPSSPSEDM